MPRLAINYANTIIYKLCCSNPEITDEYVGHTTDFTNRKRSHKTRCNNPNDKKYNVKVYQFIRENGGFENWKMIMLEEFSCENKLQAEQRERFYIETLKSALNQKIPSRTEKEWYEDNKEKVAEQHKQYRLDNKEKVAEKKKQKYIDNKEQIAKQQKQHYLNNKEKLLECNHEYYFNNKEKLLEYQKQHRLDNKEEIAEKAKQRYLKKKLENQGL